LSNKRFFEIQKAPQETKELQEVDLEICSREKNPSRVSATHYSRL